MARTISIPQTLIPVGMQQFEIDKLQPQSIGFELRISRDDPGGLASLSGKVADLLVEISPDDGAHYTSWISCPLDGGEAFDRLGNPITQAIVSGEWPGEADANGARKELKQTNVRITLVTAQQFRASGSLVWI